MSANVAVTNVDPLANPLTYTMTGNYSLPIGARYLVRITSNSNSFILTVPSGKSHRISNVGTNTFELRTTGNADLQIQAGTPVIVAWDAATNNHRVMYEYSPVDLVIDSSSYRPIANSIIKNYVDTAALGGTIEDAMSDTSVAAVQNSVIKQYVDLRALVRKNDLIITGVDEATDTANLAAAELAINDSLSTFYQGQIWIDGEVKVSAATMITSAGLRLRGLGPGAAIKITHANGQFGCGGYWDPIDSAASLASPAPCAINITGSRAETFTITNPGYTFTANTSTSVITATGHTFVDGNRIRFTTTGLLYAGLSLNTDYYVRDRIGDTFKVATTPGGTAVTITNGTQSGTHTVSGYLQLQTGDYVILWSDDAISGVVPHHKSVYGSSAKNCPMEIHVIKRVDGGNTYGIGGFVVDALQTNPKVRIVPMLYPTGSHSSAALIENLAIRQTAGINSTRLFDIRCVNTFTMRGCTWELTSNVGSPAHLLLKYCTHVFGDHNVNEGADRYSDSGDGYWIEFSVVNGGIWTQNICHRARHCFDTTCGTDAAPVRYGTPRNIIITGNIFYTEGDAPVGSLIACKTHAEGWGIAFINNDFHLSGGTNPGHGVSFFARHSIARGNRVFGGGGGCKFAILAADEAIIDDNDLNDVWKLVEITEDGNAPSDIEITRNKVHRSPGVGALTLRGGTGHKILYNEIYDGVGTAISLEGALANVEVGWNKFINATQSGTQGVIWSPPKTRIAFTVDTTTDLVTATGNNFQIGTRVIVNTTGTLPTLSSGTFSPQTFYYVVSSPLAPFELSATPGGTPLNFTGTGTGTHYITNANCLLNCNFHHNEFSDCNEIPIELAGPGDGNRIVLNSVHNSGAGAVAFCVATGKNNRIAGNDAPKTLNTYAIDCGANTGLAFTATDAGDLFTVPGHLFLNGDVVYLTGGSLPTGASPDVLYYVRDASGQTFKLSATQGGAAITLSADGSGTITETVHLLVRGNTLDGYGSNSLGLTGALASSRNTAELAYNFHD